MIRSLLTHFEQDSSLLRFFEPKMREEIELLQPPAKLNFPSMLVPTKWMNWVHYSWFYPYLSTLPVESAAALFPLFSKSQQSGLATMLKMEPKRSELPPFSTYFLAEILQKEIQKEEVIPIEALPQGALNPLIKLKWSTLMQIIDTLGLFDLACDFRQIVDKSLQKRIQNALSKEMNHFLSFATKQPIKWTSPKLNLQHWDGDAAKLQQLLHKRGLMRLAKGILQEHLSFRWHLIHRLDVGRAQVMMNALTTPVDQALIPHFRSQLLQIASRVCS
ncbi:MAG: hypothetical protein S4CHLAM81_15090 [Chlamydiales bacterium]|nr:hypothetical protein [Chlamydiales bacterium]MCH9636278.1 hypothetical protein [Chlamydiales bacterium]